MKKNIIIVCLLLIIAALLIKQQRNFKMPPPPGPIDKVNFIMDILKDRLKLNETQTTALNLTKKEIENILISSRPNISGVHNEMMNQLDKEKIDRNFFIEQHTKITNGRLKNDVIIINKLIDLVEKLNVDQRKELKKFLIEEYNKMQKRHFHLK